MGKEKKINTFDVVNWDVDDEIKSLANLIDPKILSQIDTDQKLIDKSSDKKNKILVKISEIVQDTNQKLEKDFHAKLEGGLDSIIDTVNKGASDGEYKNNVNNMISFYKGREDLYKKIIEEANADFSKESIDEKFSDLTKQNLLWVVKLPIGSFLKGFFFFVVLSLIAGFYLNTELGLPNYLIWIFLFVSFLIARFSITDRKNKKVMYFYESLLREMPKRLDKEISSIKSAIRFL